MRRFRAKPTAARNGGGAQIGAVPPGSAAKKHKVELNEQDWSELS
jgi:hypothetical protein